MPTLSCRIADLRGSAIRDLLSLTARPEILSLAGGLPALELVPHERISTVLAEVGADPRAWQYGETAGAGLLREVLAARETARLGRAVGVDEIVVTHGSQQALSLLAQVLVDPGDPVIVESPVYPGAAGAFAAAGATLVGVPLDGDGMQTEILEEYLAEGLRPRVLHTVSTFHNPGGAVLAAPRRRRLAELAERYDFWIVEDDPYGDLWFDSPPPDPVAAHSTRVLRLSSASKTLAPALRVGWLHGDRAVCAGVERLKQSADLCGSTLTQLVCARLLADGRWFDAHLGRVRRDYAARADALVAALRARFGDALWLEPVRGGMFAWGRFGDGTDTDRLLRTAVEHGVAFVPGSAFAVGEEDAAQLRSSLRLSFATCLPDTLVEAADRLALAHAQS
ncbi:PLP-dependent aminotransferase family protein [Rhodococcus rhodnii]|uniref:Aminotransferase n=1 Tax=Rhodococcus rhodnii LMG 5362 TaxID=1273125 RepID=R7WN55_9NOCA|nr:PLP-dependent aminotransferase family protein [Rhodococcus rhodnii]EOM75429.1 aminotransferase [Rhodococcus rhodnii LMG 5362]